MPIIRFNQKIVYFSHIPKCAGTSVENFLKILTGTDISFLNRIFYKDRNMRWSISSPQHITGNDISKLFPISFFDDFFTVTRHPFDRFYSAFIFQKFITKRINQEVGINEFIFKLDEYRALLPGSFDNHFLPQVDFMYPGAPYRVFKLEKGLEPVKIFLGLLFRINVKDTTMPHSLNQSEHMEYKIEPLSDNSKKIIREVYESDFRKFNY